MTRIAVVLVALALSPDGVRAGQATDSSTGAEPDRPNFVYIMVDDMGRDWLGSYGSQEDATPQIDRLAKEGTRYAACYSTAICTPTRHMLLTGRYPFRTGWIKHHDAPRWGGQFFDWRREVTFARVLKEAGYATAVAGKWQVNDLRVQVDALARHGFDEHCVWTGFETGNRPSAERYWDAYLQLNGRRKTYQGQYGPDVCNRFVCDFIARHKDGPFAVYYPMILCHGPYSPTPEVKDDPPQDNHARYKAMVGHMDLLVGNVVRTLDELGIRGRTIVFVCGDNGSSTGGQAWGRRMPNSKGAVSELGVHTPLIANCPGLVPAGRVCDDLVDFSDVLPTLAELGGAPLPEGVTLDGRSFAASLLGKPGGPRREWIFTQTGARRVVRDKRFAYYNNGRFYDVLADPLEEHDLSASTDPEIAAARGRLEKVMNSLPADAPMTGFPPTYAELRQVPDLPPGSGKLKPFAPTRSDRPKKQKRAAKAK